MTFHCLVSDLTPTVMGFVSNNSDTVTCKFACLRCGLLACFAQHGVGRLKYMINTKSHRFSYNLGIITLTTGINCTCCCSCNYLPVTHAIIFKLHPNPIQISTYPLVPIYSYSQSICFLQFLVTSTILNECNRTPR